MRKRHPTATLSEIEDVVDGQMAPLRVQMVDGRRPAQEGRTAELKRLAKSERPLAIVHYIKANKAYS